MSYQNPDETGTFTNPSNIELDPEAPPLATRRVPTWIFVVCVGIIVALCALALASKVNANEAMSKNEPSLMINTVKQLTLEDMLQNIHYDTRTATVNMETYIVSLADEAAIIFNAVRIYSMRYHRWQKITKINPCGNEVDRLSLYAGALAGQAMKVKNGVRKEDGSHVSDFFTYAGLATNYEREFRKCLEINGINLSSE